MSKYAQSPLRVFHFLACLLVVIAIAVRSVTYGEANAFWITAIIQVPALAAASMWLLDTILTRRLVLRRCGIGIPVALFAASIVLSPIFALNRGYAMQAVVIWLTNALLLFLIINLSENKKTAALFLAALLASVAAVAAHGIYQQHGGFEFMRAEAAGEAKYFASSIERELFLERVNGNEPYATFVTANLFATFLLTGLPALGMWLLATIRESKAIAKKITVATILSATIGATLLCLWQSGSLAGMTVLGAEILIFGVVLVVRFTKKSPKARAAALSAIGVLLVAATIALAPKIAANKSVQFRFGYWESALGIIRENPVTGVGLENFRWAYNRHKTPEAGEVDAAHNSVIEAFADLGALGGLAFVAMWVLFFAKVFARTRRGSDEESDETATDRGIPAAGIFAIAAITLLFLYATITATGAIEGLGAGKSAAVTMSLVKQLVWVAVFLTLALPVCCGRISGNFLRLLGFGAALGAVGFFMHSLFDMGINSYAANQAMWVALGCALVLLKPRGKRPLVDRPLPPIAQIALGFVAFALIGAYYYGPVRQSVQERKMLVVTERLLAVAERRDSRLMTFDDVQTQYRAVLEKSTDIKTISETAQMLTSFDRDKHDKMALEITKKAISLNPADFAQYSRAAQIYERTKERRKALEMWDKAIGCYPNKPVLRVMRAKLMREMNDDSLKEKIVADLEHARFLLLANRDVDGKPRHLSLELDPEKPRKRKFSDKMIYERLCRQYGINSR